MANILSRWALPERHLLFTLNILFTLFVAGFLMMSQSVWSQPSATTTTTSTSLISHQGRLADTSGEPLTGQYNMELRIYEVPTGGTPLWEEYWTGGNSVEVSDGLFNVMLGSINNTLASAIAGHNELYLAITVGTDGEMSPRVQLGSVPFAMHASDADTVDGLHASDLATTSHTHSAETMIDGWPDVIKCNGQILLWHQYNQMFVVEAPDGGGGGHGSTQYSTTIEFNADGTYKRHFGASQQNWLCANGGDIAGKSISQLYAEGKAFNLVGGSSSP